MQDAHATSEVLAKVGRTVGGVCLFRGEMTELFCCGQGRLSGRVRSNVRNKKNKKRGGTSLSLMYSGGDKSLNPVYCSV